MGGNKSYSKAFSLWRLIDHLKDEDVLDPTQILCHKCQQKPSVCIDAEVKTYRNSNIKERSDREILLSLTFIPICRHIVQI